MLRPLVDRFAFESDRLETGMEFVRRNRRERLHMGPAQGTDFRTNVHHRHVIGRLYDDDKIVPSQGCPRRDLSPPVFLQDPGGLVCHTPRVFPHVLFSLFGQTNQSNVPCQISPRVGAKEGGAIGVARGTSEAGDGGEPRKTSVAMDVARKFRLLDGFRGPSFTKRGPDLLLGNTASPAPIRWLLVAKGYHEVDPPRSRAPAMLSTKRTRSGSEKE